MTHVPYKGVGQAIIDLVAGRIEVCMISGRSGRAYIQAGKLRALGIAAPVRWSELPDVPTMEEAGVTDYKYAAWYGMWFPAGTPTEYVTRIHTEVIKAFDDPATRRTFAEQGLVPIVSTPQEFGKTVVGDLELHRRLVARMGLVPQ